VRKRKAAVGVSSTDVECALCIRPRPLVAKLGRRGSVIWVTGVGMILNTRRCVVDGCVVLHIAPSLRARLEEWIRPSCLARKAFGDERDLRRLARKVSKVALDLGGLAGKASKDGATLVRLVGKASEVARYPRGLAGKPSEVARYPRGLAGKAWGLHATVLAFPAGLSTGCVFVARPRSDRRTRVPRLYFLALRFARASGADYRGAAQPICATSSMPVIGSLGRRRAGTRTAAGRVGRPLQAIELMPNLCASRLQ
jgi:hypothetical protein